MPNWYPGQNAQGQKVFGDVTGLARGYWSNPPVVTSPGTVASGGTVTNTTGLDCMVYMAAAGGIGGVSFLPQGTVTAGTVAAAGLISVYVPVNQSIVVNYTGALTWHWLAV